MIEFLRKRWFLCSLAIVIPLGIAMGFLIPRELIADFNAHYVGQSSRVITAIVLFLMSVTLDSQKLRQAIRKPLPTLWACGVNYVILPFIAIPLAGIQSNRDFAVGLLIAAAVPSTMASASIWTRKAHGNDAVSLLTTCLTNGLCFVITPFWLARMLGDVVRFDILEMIERLFFTALLPITIGQIIRLSTQTKGFADRHKISLGGIAQGLLLLLIFRSALDGGSQLQASEAGNLGFLALLNIWFGCLVLHFSGVIIAFYGGQMLNFDRESIVATVFSGSQKTLPIGIYIATDLLAGRGLPFAAFPILIFHASQLFLDALLIDPLAQWVDRADAVGDIEQSASIVDAD